MRLGDGGFISTVDTIVAMEALVHYSYNSRIKDITDLYVEIDIPDSNMTETIPITGENIARMHRIDIPNVWGHINIVANGAGNHFVSPWTLVRVLSAILLCAHLQSIM